MTGSPAPAQAGSAATLAALAGELFAAPDLDTLLQRAVECAVPAMACDCAGVIVWPGDGLDQHRSAGSDWRAVKADQLQRTVGEGPGLSLLIADSVTARDTASDAQWPQWGPLIAAELGLHSVLSVALPGRDRQLGVLNLYSARPDAFTTSDQAMAMPLAVQIAIAVSVTTTAGSLQQAIDSRTRIGQATGILMERFGLDAGDAFELLKRHSQEHNIPMRIVAAGLLAERQLPPRWGRPADRRRR